MFYVDLIKSPARRGDFENAEGNIMCGNAILEFLAAKLPISRLQRNLNNWAVSFSAVEELNWRAADQIGSHHDDGKYPQVTSCEAAKSSAGGHVLMT